MSRHEPVEQAHEGEWIYVSGAVAHLGPIIRAKGWLAITGEVEQNDPRTAARRVNALRTADACIIDVSKASIDVGAELATAVFAERPVIALQDSRR